MKTLRLFAAALLLASAAAATAAARLPPTVAQALAAAGLPASAVAIVVQDAATGAAQLKFNAETAMNPASLMKLLTTAAALDTLGPAHTWKTEAWLRGELAAGVLEGDLYLKGGGDPKLTLEQFWLLLRELRARGLREIRGDLVLDRSLFGVDDEGLIDDKPLRAYNVAPDALLLNFKAVRLRLMPAAATKSVTVLAEPLPEPLQIANQLSLVGGACGDWKEALTATYTPAPPRLSLAGGYPLACGEKNLSLGVMDHAQYVDGLFRPLWREMGGRIVGVLRSDTLPADARLFATIESPPLAEQIRDINKFSNNVMARQLFLALGAAAGKTATAAAAEAALRDWLTRRGLELGGLVIDNGSGLSRRARISADGLARVLALAWHSALMPEFVASLPLSAVDGTMRKRLTHDGVAGQAHIKTGSLDGVKSIAGYVRDRAGRWQIVVCVVNHAAAAAAGPAQDALLQWVYERGR